MGSEMCIRDRIVSSARSARRRARRGAAVVNARASVVRRLIAVTFASVRISRLLCRAALQLDGAPVLCFDASCLCVFLQRSLGYALDAALRRAKLCLVSSVVCAAVSLHCFELAVLGEAQG